MVSTINSTTFQGSSERTVHHLQFTGWPDKDIPRDVAVLVDFRQYLNNTKTTLNGPMIVHCR